MHFSLFFTSKRIWYQSLLSVTLIVICIHLNTLLAATEFKIITLHHRLAGDIIETIRPFVGDNGTLSAMQNQLIIRTTPQSMREVEQLVESLDVARQNLMISVRRQAVTQESQRSFGASGQQRIGQNAISNSRNVRRSTDNQIDLNLQNSRQNSQSFQQQVVRVIDGEAAFISVGQSIPYTQEWLILTQRYGLYQHTTAFIEISTGFAVRATSVGNQIEVAITPRFSALNQQGTVDFESLTTSLRVTKGQWINIADVMEQKDEVSRKIFNYQRAQSQQNSALNIKID